MPKRPEQIEAIFSREWFLPRGRFQPLFSREGGKFILAPDENNRTLLLWDIRATIGVILSLVSLLFQEDCNMRIQFKNF
jgi:hypothetical protein